MSTGKPSPPKPFSRILIAEIDGTARSLRHRQLQFHRLQAVLTKNRGLFVQALKDDYGYTEVEALFEYSLSLTELRAHYDSLDFEKEVQSTKTIENCTEGLNRHASVGIVYIVPRSGLYSVLSPLCAAMVAGNCVIVEILQTTNRTSSALRNTLSEALSGDTFAVSKERPDSAFLRQCTVVLQTNEVLSTPTKESSDLLRSKKLIVSPSSAKNLAFVDRTADLSLAARSLIVAKFGFGNSSSYAPDVVFVHEAVAKAFSARLVEVAKGYIDGLETGAGRQKASSSGKGVNPQQLNGHKVIFSSQRGAIVEANQGSEVLQASSLEAAASSKTLLLCKVTSTDEAIDLSSDLTSTHHPQTAAAALIFASPSDAQYLANSVDAYLTCVNAFPTELLVGPKLPPSANRTDEPSSVFPRYKRHLFEDSRPTVQKQSLRVLHDGVDALVQVESKKFRQWIHSAEAPLKPTGQRSAKGVGFFDAAIMLSLTTVGLPLLVGLGFVGRLAFRRYGGGKLSFS